MFIVGTGGDILRYSCQSTKKDVQPTKLSGMKANGIATPIQSVTDNVHWKHQLP